MHQRVIRDLSTTAGITLGAQQRNQIFLGMVAVQEQPVAKMSSLIEDCNSSGTC